MINQVEGEYFKLYDTHTPLEKNHKMSNQFDMEIEYAVRDLPLKKLFHYCMSETVRRLKRKVR